MNYKRVERLYQEAGLPVRRRTRKKVPVGERQPLLRPSAANEVWSMDSVFDRTAEGRVVKCLTIVDDAHPRGCGHRNGAGSIRARRVEGTGQTGHAVRLATSDQDR